MTLTNFWWIIIWPVLIGSLSYFINARRPEVVLGKIEYRWNWFSVSILTAPFVIWTGYRGNQFGDTALYRSVFINMPTGLSNLISFVETRPRGKGFAVFEYLIKTFITHSDIGFFLILALIQLFCIVRVFRKYSCDFWLSFFLFVASTDYVLWTFNGIRQFLAATLIFTCIPLIEKRKYLLMCVVVLAVAVIHSTALVFIPFIFIVNGKAWNTKTLLFIGGIILAVLYVERVSGFIVQAMEDTVYEGDIDIYLADDGTNVLRALFYAVPTIMSFVYKSYIDHANSRLINICTNLSIVSTGIYVFSIFTSGVLIGAVPIYFSLANYILIPWLIEEVFEPKSALCVKGIFIAVYTAFFYYQCGPTWGFL